ncbi:MAG: phosphatase PAP2 family protein [Candidatus Nitrosoglobus sp.]|jgi:undecaprenyl-diphosphatase
MKRQIQKQSRPTQSHSLTTILVYSTVIFGGFALFLKLAQKVHQHGEFWFDAPILSFFAEHQTSVVNYFFLLITPIGSIFFLLPLGLLILSVLLHYHYYLEAIFLSIGFSGVSLINHGLKSLLIRDRPILFPSLQEHVGFSFPSGHAAQITAFALCLFLIIRRIQPHWQWPAAILLSMLVMCVATSRLYLQAHYPSDILGGCLVALIWVFSVDALIQIIIKPKNLDELGE